jgi:hypothetical protein
MFESDGVERLESMERQSKNLKSTQIARLSLSL